MGGDYAVGWGRQRRFWWLTTGAATLALFGLVSSGVVLLVGADLAPGVQALDINDETIFAGRERYLSLAVDEPQLTYTPGE